MRRGQARSAGPDGIVSAGLDARDPAFLRVQGAQIRIRESGDPALPPVLLLHGIGRSLEDWAPQHDRLADAYRVISIDLPGFGLSDRLPGPVSLPVLARGALATLDALGETRPVHVMGNSLGGAVALQMLAHAPDRVSSLVLVNSAGFGKEVAIALRLLAVPGLGRRLLRGVDRKAARRTERALFFDPSFVTDERIDLAVRLAERPGNAEVFLEAARELGTFRGIRGRWRSALLAQVARHPRPTLILWGDRDLILPGHHVHAARALLPHARSHVFGRTGHMPQIERADRFAELVRAFL
jgi:pimeloyl-ACP methyl ester carboxylesterase